MDALRTLAIVALLSMLIYVVLVNIFSKKEALHTEGILYASEEAYIKAQLGLPGSSSSSSTGISNKLQGTIEGLSLSTGSPVSHLDDRAAVRENVTGSDPAYGSALYNPEEKGILPVNHDLFEKTADFGSDVTNINQFYRNNPEVFEIQKSPVYVPNAAEWDEKSRSMAESQRQSGGGQIHAANFAEKFAPLHDV